MKDTKQTMEDVLYSLRELRREVTSLADNRVKPLEKQVFKLASPPIYEVGSKHNIYYSGEKWSAVVKAVFTEQLPSRSFEWNYSLSLTSSYDHKESSCILGEEEFRQCKMAFSIMSGLIPKQEL